MKSNGFIDEEEIIQLAYGRLQLPYGALDEIQPYELNNIFIGREKVKKEELEAIAYAVRAGYVSARTGKKIKLFEEQKQHKVKKVTKEQKERELAELDNLFNS